MAKATRGREPVDPASLNMTTNVLGHGRFLFLTLADGKPDAQLMRSIEALGADFENMHEVSGHPSPEASQRGRIQYLCAQPGMVEERDLADQGMSGACILIRLEGSAPGPLIAYENAVRELMRAQGGTLHVRAGVHRPRSYTSHAMTQFAYAPALAPNPASAHPFGVVTPMNKLGAWWTMDWMRRESFFLPRYDEAGNVIAKGHALASADGIPFITRRLYHNADGYGHDGGYDFLGYFEFAEESAAVFRSVMASLRDRAQNPEWEYVREGPEWWGRRVRSIAATSGGA